MEKRTGRVAGLTWGLMESAAHGQMLVGGLLSRSGGTEASVKSTAR